MWSGDQRMQKAYSKHHRRDVAIDAKIVEQRRKGAQQQPRDDRADPRIGPAHDGQSEQHDRLAGGESTGVELPHASCEQAARNACEKAGKRKGPYLVSDDIDASGKGTDFAATDHRPGATGSPANMRQYENV